jgi:hypothetical protein
MGWVRQRESKRAQEPKSHLQVHYIHIHISSVAKDEDINVFTVPAKAETFANPLLTVTRRYSHILWRVHLHHVS